MSSTRLAWLDAPARGHERSRSREACCATVAPDPGRLSGPESGMAPRRRVWRRCSTGATLRDVPTKRRRHAITETPRVQAALNELRKELGTDRVEVGELVVLGAGVKLAAIRSERDGYAAKRRRLADRVRSRVIGADVDASDAVRSSGWARI